MGLIGTLFPMLPGIIIIAAGCIWQGVVGSHSLAWWEWTVLALLVAGGLVIDKISGGMGAKNSAVPRQESGAPSSEPLWAPSCPIVGLLVMPFLGSLLAELLRPQGHCRRIQGRVRRRPGDLTGLLLETPCGLLILCAWFCSCYFLF